MERDTRAVSFERIANEGGLGPRLCRAGSGHMNGPVFSEQVPVCRKSARMRSNFSSVSRS